MRPAPYRNALPPDSVQRIPQQRQVLKPRCSVRVHHQQLLPPAMQHPMPHRPALAQVLLQLYDANVRPRIPLRHRERLVRGPVRRPVVDDEDLVRAALLRGEIRDGGVEHRREPRGLVVRGDDDGDVYRSDVVQGGQGLRRLRRRARAVVLLGRMLDYWWWCPRMQCNVGLQNASMSASGSAMAKFWNIIW